MKAASAFLVVSFLCAGAAAGTIQIQITQSAELRDGVLSVAVAVRNSGDEAAHSVVPLVRFRGQEARGAIEPTLPPDGPLEAKLDLPAGALGEGRWPYLVAVEYTDANHYPFQALLVATLVIGSPPPAQVAIPRFESPGIARSGELALQVKNLSAAERSISIHLLLPDALEASEPSRTLSLAPWEEKTLSAGLVNRTALPGSRYPVFVAAEYDAPPFHQALVAQSAVEILAPQDPSRGRARGLWIGAGVLGLLFAALVAYRLVRR